MVVRAQAKVRKNRLHVCIYYEAFSVVRRKRETTRNVASKMLLIGFTS